jgi:hypothetical protein
VSIRPSPLYAGNSHPNRAAENTFATTTAPLSFSCSPSIVRQPWYPKYPLGMASRKAYRMIGSRELLRIIMITLVVKPVVIMVIMMVMVPTTWTNEIPVQPSIPLHSTSSGNYHLLLRFRSLTCLMSRYGSE